MSYRGDFPCLPRNPTNEAILVNKTNNYMQKFKYQTFRDLKPYQVNVLRKNSTIIAFNRLRRNDYLVAAKPQDLYEIKGKIFPKVEKQEQPYPPIDR